MRAILITFLTLILIVGGVFLFFTFSSDTGFHSKWYASSIDQVPLSYAESIIAQKKTESEDITLLNSAIENLKIETCQKILAPSRRTECVDMLLAAEAFDTDSLEKCKTLTDPNRAIQCQDNIYTSRAEKG